MEMTNVSYKEVMGGNYSCPSNMSLHFRVKIWKGVGGADRKSIMNKEREGTV